MKLLKPAAAILAAASVLSMVAPAASALSASRPAIGAAAPAPSIAGPTGGYRPPYQLAQASVLSVTGSPDGAQTILVRGSVPGLSPGAVLVSSPGKAAPYGLLVTVKSVHSVGSDTKLGVVPASLTQALAPGRYTQHLEPGTGPGAAAIKPASAGIQVVRPESSTAPKSATVTINKWVSCTGTLRSVDITGSLTISPKVDLSFVVGFGRINSASFHFSVVEDARLRASLSAAASCSVNFPLATMTFPVFFVGPVPITATVALKADATIGVEGSLTVSGSQHYESSNGLDYTVAGGVRPYAHNPLPTWHLDKPQFSGKGKVEIGLTASVALQVAALLGPRLDARGYLGLSADPSQLPWWRLYAGITVSGGLKILMFDLGSWQIFHKEWTLWTALGIRPNALPGGVAGVPFSARIQIVGGKAPYTVTTPDALPPGLMLNQDGTITGTPAGTGQDTTTNFVAVVRDSNGDQVARIFSIAVHRMGIATTSIAATAPGMAYTQTLSTVGAVGTPVWGIDSGSLPAGLTLSGSGVISGTVADVGTTQSFVVRATDVTGASGTAQLSLTVVQPVEPPDPGGGGCAIVKGALAQPMRPIC